MSCAIMAAADGFGMAADYAVLAVCSTGGNREPYRAAVGNIVTSGDKTPTEMKSASASRSPLRKIASFVAQAQAERDRRKNRPYIRARGVLATPFWAPWSLCKM